MKLGVWGHSRSPKVPPFSSSGMISYSTSIVTMAVSHSFRDTPTYWSKIAHFSHPPCIRHPIRGEAIGVKQRPLVTKKLE